MDFREAVAALTIAIITAQQVSEMELRNSCRWSINNFCFPQLFDWQFFFLVCSLAIAVNAEKATVDSFTLVL